MTLALRSPFKTSAFAVLAAFAFFSPFQLQAAGFNLGTAGNYALFSLGGGMKDDDLTGKANIYGDMGAAGAGVVDITGGAILHGDLYYHTPGSLKYKSRSQITGNIFHDAATDALLNQGVTDANNASDMAAST